MKNIKSVLLSSPDVERKNFVPNKLFQERNEQLQSTQDEERPATASK